MFTILLSGRIYLYKTRHWGLYSNVIDFAEKTYFVSTLLCGQQSQTLVKQSSIIQNQTSEFDLAKAIESSQVCLNLFIAISFALNVFVLTN